MSSPYNLFRQDLQYRPTVLKCRFVIGAGPCHRHVGPHLVMCRHLESAMYEAGKRFLVDMEHDGWESADGRLRIRRGPMPATEVSTSDPSPPPNLPHGAGPPSYDTPLVELPTVDTTDAWEYELVGTFVRPMPPAILTTDTLETLRQDHERRNRGR